jgi:16S rRNA (cytosine967-C5)-methyltransferase
MFDRVLVDAPCSALGVMRRHPEIRWRRRPSDVTELASIQAAILDQAANAVRPGGVLVYSVCTTTRQEGEEQISRFLAQRTDYGLDFPADDVVEWSKMAEGESLRLQPHVHGTDGFYAARLRRQETP